MVRLRSARLVVVAAASVSLVACGLGGLDALTQGKGGAGGGAGSDAGLEASAGGAAGHSDAATLDASGGSGGGAVDASGGSGGGAFDASFDAPHDAAADSGTCAQGAVGWFTTQASFEANVAGLTHVSFSKRGDGTTTPTAGMTVPPNEYLACCGFTNVYYGSATNGSIIWVGNTTSGFELMAQCGIGGPLGCTGSPLNGIRFTFSNPVRAVGGDYAGGTTMQIYAVDGSLIDQLTLNGSGTNFLGHASKTPIGSVVFADFGGENVSDIEYAGCK